MAPTNETTSAVMLTPRNGAAGLKTLLLIVGPPNRNPPIIAPTIPTTRATAWGDRARLLAWELGADDFLSKPFRTKEVLTRRNEIKLKTLQQRRLQNLQPLAV